MVQDKANQLQQLMLGAVIVMLIAVVWGSYCVGQVKGEIGIQARSEQANLLALEEAINDASSNLAGQVQEWKDVLLRSYDSNLIEHHTRAFEQRAEAVERDLRAAAQTAENLGFDTQNLADFVAQHQELSRKYRSALQSLVPGSTASVRRIDRGLRGVDRDLQDAIFQERERLEALAMSGVTGLSAGELKGGLKSIVLQLGWLVVLLPVLAVYFFLRIYMIQREVSKSDALQRSILDSISDAVLVADATGRVVTMNPRAEALMGLYTADVHGQPLSQVFHLTHAETGFQISSPAEQVLREGKSVELSNGVLLRHADGREIPIEDSAAPIEDVDGEINGVVMVFHDVTQRFEMMRSLELERTLFRQTFDLAEVGMAHVSVDGRWSRVNRCLCLMTGYSEAELLALSFQGVNHPDDNVGDEDLLRRLLSGESNKYKREKRYLHKDGHVVWVSVISSMVHKADGSLDYGISIIEDITSRKLAETEMRMSRQRYVALFEQMPEGALLFDSRLKVAECNPEAIHQLGYSMDELLTLHVWDIEAIDDQEDIAARQAKVMESGRDDFDSWYRRCDGSLFAVDVSVKRVEMPDGELYFQAIFRDITEERQAAEQIEHLAYHDPLTGLPNRRLLHDRLGQSLNVAKRHKTVLAVLYLDLDHFKDVNDSMGHDAGDLLLKLVATRLQKCVREEDTLSRVGGDEFVIVLNDIGGPNNAESVAAKILEQMSRPILMGEDEIRVTPSIGISMYPQDGRDDQDLLKFADVALFQAKKDGRSTYRFHTAAMHQQALERINLERLLRVALKRNEFELHYQPQVSLTSGKVIGCEALIRWNQPVMGLVPPAQFIPVAEHCGMILEIGEWVLREACKQARRWQDDGHELKVAINVSARQLMRPVEMMRTLRGALVESGVSPSMLELELTENLLFDPQSMGDVLEEISALGVSLALDDFGTGYSSLSCLRRFPITILKIDKSFVSNSANSEADAEMVRTIIGLAHNMKMTLIAEGVENLQQGLKLAESGCEVAQGYHYSRPLPVDEFDAMLRTRRKTM